MSVASAQDAPPPALPVPPPVPLILDQEGVMSDFGSGYDVSPDDEVEGDGPLSTFDVPVLEIPGLVAPTTGEVDRVGSFSLLNKVTAKLQPIELVIGEAADVGSMSIVMRDCISTPPEEPPETKVFLEVYENKAGFDNQLFSGWMFASSPGINGLEHPVYDLWPTACKTSSGEDFTGIN